VTLAIVISARDPSRIEISNPKCTYYRTGRVLRSLFEVISDFGRITPVFATPCQCVPYLVTPWYTTPRQSQGFKHDMCWQVEVMSRIQTVLNQLSGQIPIEVAFEGLYAGIVQATLATAIILRKEPVHLRSTLGGDLETRSRLPQSTY